MSKVSHNNFSSAKEVFNNVRRGQDVLHASILLIEPSLSVHLFPLDLSVGNKKKLISSRK